MTVYGQHGLVGTRSALRSPSSDAAEPASPVSRDGLKLFRVTPAEGERLLTFGEQSSAFTFKKSHPYSYATPRNLYLAERTHISEHFSD